MNKMVEFKPVKGYEMINDNLGRGSFGQTVLIRDPSIDELFVCKKYMPQQGLKKEDFFSTFKKEIKLMYNINHPNVVRIFTYYLYEDIYTGYIVMEYVDGTNIDDWFSMYFMQGADSNQIFRQLIEGFACIERNGIIHRDIREGNILISKNDKVKIIDFGLGKNMNESELSLDSFNALINRGLMQKFPKEFSEGKYTSKTDMFCLAELFSRLLKKYEINDFKHNYILQKMMQHEPDDRYGSFEDILKALDKKDFKQVVVSEYDREVYNKFIGEIMNCLSTYSEKPVFETATAKIIAGMGEILDNNCLNYRVDNTTPVIGIFVKSPYRYYSKRTIEVDSIQNFYSWIIDKEDSFQQIVVNNIINRLASIPVKIEEELPF